MEEKTKLKTDGKTKVKVKEKTQPKKKGGSLGKTLCRGEGVLSGKDLKAFLTLVKKPRFYCENCHRVARKKKFLCKPARLEGK